MFPWPNPAAGDQVQPGVLACFGTPKMNSPKTSKYYRAFFQLIGFFPHLFLLKRMLIRFGKGLHRKNDPMNICLRANGDLPQDLLPVDSPMSGGFTHGVQQIQLFPLIIYRFDGPRIYNVYILYIYIYIICVCMYIHIHIYVYYIAEFFICSHMFPYMSH